MWNLDSVSNEIVSTSAMKLIHFQLPPKFIASNEVVDANVVLNAGEALIYFNLLTKLTATFQIIFCHIELKCIDVPHPLRISWVK